MTILQKIYQLGFTEKQIRLDTAVLDKNNNTIVVTYIYPSYVKLTSEQKTQIIACTQENFEKECKVQVKFNVCFLDKDIAYSKTNEFITKNLPLLATVFDKNDMHYSEKEDLIEIRFDCDEMTYGFAQRKNFCEKLQEYLTGKFFYNFNIIIVNCKENPILTDVLTTDDADFGLSNALQEEAKINKHIVKIKDIIYGKQIEDEPIFIQDLNYNNGEKIVLAGEIKEPKFSTFMRKAQVEGGLPEERKKFTFTLVDPSGKINMVVFPTDKTFHQLEIIPEGHNIIVSGITNVFNGNFNIKVNSISHCDINTKPLQKIYRKPNLEYIYVKPQQYFEKEQMNLFSMFDTQSCSNNLKNKSFVVFDLETTGFYANTCHIIEIGAVKIENGNITQTFQTLVNPNQKLTNEIKELTHINDEMLVNAPTIDQVLPDFYKFVQGCVLNAYNIDFDYSFIKFNGEKLRLNFDNEQIDTLKLARDKVPSLHNYKLGTVVKALDITLENAHRALADAMATAKVFMKLA